VIFIIAVAACEAAVALALVIALYQQRGRLDIADWQSLREADLPPFEDKTTPLLPDEQGESWPALTPAGVAPQVPPDKTDYRPNV
jgi:NADH-quinone oxidoreductase subunit K